MNKYSLRFLLVLLSFLVIDKVYCQVFPVEIIKYSGPPNEFLNIVILGDGYTSSQQGLFISDANNAINGFLAQEPFSTYKDSINVFAVKVISNVEGASLDPNNLIDNYFGSSYWSYGIERLLVAWNSNNISTVLNANTPFYDEGIVMVNNSKYGGSGGTYAVFSTNPQSIELLLHEFGHSFANLADEYWAGSQNAEERSNMTQDNNPTSIRWKDFLNYNGIGIYPYDESPDWFRPHQNCKMRYLGSPYCDVCKNKIASEIKTIANTDTVGSPIAYFDANNIDILKGTSINFYDFSTNRPKSWEWNFEGGIPASSTQKNPIVTYNNIGNYSVTLKVTNQQGNNTIIKSSYIKVRNAASSSTINYSNKIRVFPNPANNLIIVETGSDFVSANFKIVNSTGMVVKEGVFDKQINISELSSGIYIIILNNNRMNISSKFVKE